jgi:hypothetical protein
MSSPSTPEPQEFVIFTSTLHPEIETVDRVTAVVLAVVEVVVV